MGHKPDRRGRAARTAKMLASNARSERQRADFRKKLSEAPKRVQGEYHRYRRRIRDFCARDPGRTAIVLYPTARSPNLAEIEIAWLLDLLTHRAQGWDVRLIVDTMTRDAKLVFRFDPRGN